MITPAQVEDAIHWLNDNAEPAAIARAQRVYMETWIKTVMAQEMQKHAGLPVAAQEREARCSSAYLKSLEALRVAVEADEYNRFVREAKGALIEAWRTMESTRRAEGKAFQ